MSQSKAFEAFFQQREVRRPGLLVLGHAVTALLGAPLLMAVWGLTILSWFILKQPYINYTASLFLPQAVAIVCSVVILVFIIAKFNPFGVSLVFSAVGMVLYFMSLFDRGVMLGFSSVFTVDCFWRKENLTLEEYFVCTQDGLHETFAPLIGLAIWILTIILTVQAIVGVFVMFVDIIWLLTTGRKSRNESSRVTI